MTAGELRDRVRVLLGDLIIPENRPDLIELRDAIQTITGDTVFPRETPVYLVSRDGETLRHVIKDGVTKRPVRVVFKGEPADWGQLFLIQGTSDRTLPTQLNLWDLRNQLWKAMSVAHVRILCDGFGKKHGSGSAHWSDLDRIVPACKLIRSGNLEFYDLSLNLHPE